jgi:arylsulfatase A-like enzyme
MKIFIVFLIVISLSIEISAQNEKYNVLFIAIDDLNDYVSVLQDYPGVKTPNLDKFSKKSVVFKHAYCSAPVCNPSRLSLLTGKSPINTGLYELLNSYKNSEVASKAALLPELFKQNGYTTMWSGKIFHTGSITEATRPGKNRLDSIWDDQKGHDGGYGPMTTENNVSNDIAKPVWWDYQEWTGPDEDFPDVQNSDITIERLQQDYDKPFFMALGFYRPHDPWTVPKRFFDMYPLDSVKLPLVFEDDLDDLPEVGKEMANHPLLLEDLKNIKHWRPSVRAYLSAITFMDYNLGRVLFALENSSYYKNTIVVLWSDNGFHLGEKHHFAKQALWEQTTKVLLMIHVPGMTEKSGSRNQTVSLLDIYPTLVELCNLSQPSQELDGISLVPIIKDKDFYREQPAITYYRYGSVSIRTKEWRYIRYYDGSDELYNEIEDPYEHNNLAGNPDYQQVISEIERWYPEKITPTVRKTLEK